MNQARSILRDLDVGGRDRHVPAHPAARRRDDQCPAGGGGSATRLLPDGRTAARQRRGRPAPQGDRRLAAVRGRNGRRSGPDVRDPPRVERLRRGIQLADHIDRKLGRAEKTIAFVPESLSGYATFLALACDEIVLGPERDDRADHPARRGGQPGPRRLRRVPGPQQRQARRSDRRDARPRRPNCCGSPTPTAAATSC